MNRIYRIIRNPLTGNCAVASELARSQGNRSRKLSTIAIGIAACLALPAMASAVFNGDLVVSGDMPWHVNGPVTVGDRAAGNLTVSGGARFSNTSGGSVGLTIGIGNGSTAPRGQGVVTVTGQGSTLTTDGGLMIGHDTEGSLRIEAGGTVQNKTYAYIGAYDGSDGEVTVNGPGSLWKMDGAWMMVGSAGTGRLTIEDGGKVIMENAAVLDSRIGDRSKGELRVAGADSEWRSNGDLTVGRSATGTLTITDGGLVRNAGGHHRLWRID